MVNKYRVWECYTLIATRYTDARINFPEGWQKFFAFFLAFQFCHNSTCPGHLSLIPLLLSIDNIYDIQESRAIAKKTARCALYMDALKNFGSPWLRPRLLFPKLLMGFCLIDRMKVRAKFEVRSFTRSWDNRGYFETLGSPWIRPRSLFCKLFNGVLFE